MNAVQIGWGERYAMHWVSGASNESELEGKTNGHLVANKGSRWEIIECERTTVEGRCEMMLW